MMVRGFIVRPIAAAVLVLATGAFIFSRTQFERVPASEPFDTFPHQFVSWQSRDTPIDRRLRELLGDGRFLSRTYISKSEVPIDLFIGYYPTQRTGSTPHSPQQCLPGAGWVFIDTTLVRVPVAGGRSFQTREYLISKGPERALVFYWYQAHGRVITSDYAAKLYLFVDAVRLNRTDGALVRVLTPLASGEEVACGRARLSNFVGSMVPVLDRYIPN